MSEEENINKIFETEKKKLKQDILFLKEDILKDFRQIETKLNTKYDNQSTNIFKQLGKFDNSLNLVNNRINKLSTLISTDKNIQEKISQLYEYKSKLNEDIVNHNISLKNISMELKTAINNYDTLFSNSIIYPGVIGPNSKFSTFHELIDYILLNITQLIIFKEKYILDFNSYKTKLESLIKSFKMQAESIMMNTTELINKKIDDLEKKFQSFFKNQENTIIDLKMDNNKINLTLDKLTKVKKNNDIKSEQYKKLDNEIYILKYYNNIIMNKCEDYENDIKLIKMKLNIKPKIEEDISPDEYPKRNRNNSQYLRNDFMDKSIVKKYILGELGIKDMKLSIKNQNNNNDNNIDIKNKILLNNKSQNNIINKFNKRMTFCPNNISIQKLENNLSKDFNNNKNNDIDNSHYSDININKNLNNINEEKEEDIDYINIYKEKTQENKYKLKIEKNNKLINENIKENEKENLSSSLYEEEDIHNENKSIDKNNKEINNHINKDLKNSGENQKNINKKDVGQNIKEEDIINKFNKDNFNSNSYEKDNCLKNYKNNSCPKLIENSNEKNLLENKLINNKFYKIENDISINSSGFMNSNNPNHKKFNQTSIPFLQNQSHNYLNLKKNKYGTKLNIIDLNFDEANSFIKGNEKLKKIVNNKKDIKELKNNRDMDRNRNRTIEKNKIYKKLKMDNSDLNPENNSERIIINNNLGNNYYYNMLLKEDLLNYSSVDYLNYIHKNKINLNSKKIHIKKINK